MYKLVSCAPTTLHNLDLQEYIGKWEYKYINMGGNRNEYSHSAEPKALQWSASSPHVESTKFGNVLCREPHPSTQQEPAWILLGMSLLKGL